MGHFSGKIAIVTGGASGIGKSLCQQLVARGGRVVVADINGDGAAKVAASLGDSATSQTIDVCDREGVDALVSDTVKHHGRLDLMFNNAGIAIVGDAAHFTPDDWDRLIDINIRGVVHGTCTAYGQMITQRRGHIVNTASLAGLIPAPHFVAYGMSKHAVVGLSTSLRVEAAGHNVRVSTFCPGVVGTPMVVNAERRGFEGDVDLDELNFSVYDVDKCVEDVLTGVRKNRGIIVVSPMAKAAHAAFRASPRLVDTFMQREYPKMTAKLEH